LGKEVSFVYALYAHDALMRLHNVLANNAPIDEPSSGELIPSLQGGIAIGQILEGQKVRYEGQPTPVGASR